MPRPNTYIFTAMLIMLMAVMDIVIVSVSADPSANLTYLSRSKRQLPGFYRQAGGVDTINDPTAECAEQGIPYFCFERACAKRCNEGSFGRNPFQAAGPPNRNVWCYTSKGPGNDEQFVGCANSQDCSPLWNCATKCSVQPKTPDNQLCQVYGCLNGQCWSTCNHPTVKYGRCATGEGPNRGGIKTCVTNTDCKPKVNWKCETPCTPH